MASRKERSKKTWNMAKAYIDSYEMNKHKRLRKERRGRKLSFVWTVFG